MKYLGCLNVLQLTESIFFFLLAQNYFVLLFLSCSFTKKKKKIKVNDMNLSKYKVRFSSFQLQHGVLEVFLFNRITFCFAGV